MPRWMYGLLLFTIVTPILNVLSVPPLLLFIFAGLGIIPLAVLIGLAVERLAEHTEEEVGGLLFATFGNATELIIGVFALMEDLVDVVRAAIIGTILCNVLLVLGISTCVGSIKHGRLHFARHVASQYASLLAICVVGLLLPSFAELLASHAGQTQITERGVELSVLVAILLLIGYLCSILFSVFHVGNHSPRSDDPGEPPLGAVSERAIELLQPEYRQMHPLLAVHAARKYHLLHHSISTPALEDQPAASASAPEEAASAAVATAAPSRTNWLALLPTIAFLLAATGALAWLSEILVGAIEPFTQLLGWNPAFVGLVFLPLVGSFPEYYHTAKMALDKRVEMVLAASAGSSIQIALLVAPVLVLVGVLTGHPLDLFFSVIELAVLGVATFLYSEIIQDGELVWLEGALLLLIYAMMGATVFLFGA